MAKKLRGLQKDVVHFYRQCIRACYQKQPEYRKDFLEFTRQEFEKHRDLERKDITTIEYLLRTGHRKLEMFSNPNLRKIH